MLRNDKVINGIAAICSVLQAYESLKNDVRNPEELEQVSADMVAAVCTENEVLSNSTNICNTDASTSKVIGSCHMTVNPPQKIADVLMKYIPQYLSKNQISVPVRIDYTKTFSMLIDVCGNVPQASIVAQNFLYTCLSNNSALNFRCADLVSGGSFFTSVHSVLAKLSGKSGGKVYTKPEELSELIKDLETAASEAMKQIGGTSESVIEYNRINQAKIKEYLIIMRLDSADRIHEWNRLKVLVRNGRKYGMSFILVGDANMVSHFSEETDFEVHLKPGTAQIGSQALIPFEFSEMSTLTDSEINDIVSSMQSAEFVDTYYANHPELHTEYFGMNSESAIRIPFAIDRNGCVQHFEIGGEAPPHALIAGSTGSGKSVALHSLIMQTIRNYHPDDVEIWAIDYKAVEFDTYIEHRTPHFRVIAHDTSSEFSLSLIDALYEEYEKRKQMLLDAKVKNINQYRRLMGSHTMPRILVIIDEFQLMTQAVQEYTGNKDYRTRLENLLKLTRAMGISFILCSQTIASGLSGLTDGARDQIGCRFCLKHEDDNEIRETLMLSGPDATKIIEKAREQKTGQGIYKRARWAKEHSPDGKAYEFLQSYVLYIDEKTQKEIIDQANTALLDNYIPKEEIIVRGGGRFYINEKSRHPIVRFTRGEYEPEDECVEWYPAAPTTLADAFRLELDNSASANILMIGEDDDLRESIVVHSVFGFLMNPANKVVATMIEENNPDRQRLVALLKNIQSDRFVLNTDIHSTISTIKGMKKIRPTPGRNTIYIWYGLDKLKNELFLLQQDNEENESPLEAIPANPASREDLMADLMGFLSDLNGTSETKSNSFTVSDEELSFDNAKNILKQAFEVGPENNMLHMAIFNNRKSMKKCGLIDLDNFENRIGTRMSTDDSYELFGSSLAIGKANENTVVYYAGSGQVTPLRPYLIPDSQWFATYSQALSEV